MQLELELKDPALKGFKRRIIEHVRANPMETECDIVDVVLGLQEILDQYHAIIRDKYEHDLAEKEVMVQAFYDLMRLFKDYDWIQSSIENHETHGVLRSRNDINYVDDNFLFAITSLFMKFEVIKVSVTTQLQTHCWEYKEKVHSELLIEKATAEMERNNALAQIGYERQVSRIHAYELFLSELDDLQESIRKENHDVFDILIQRKLTEKFNVIRNKIKYKMKNEGHEKLLGRLKYLNDIMEMVNG